MQNAESIIWKQQQKKQNTRNSAVFSVFSAVYTGKKVFTYNFDPRTRHKLANNISWTKKSGIYLKFLFAI